MEFRYPSLHPNFPRLRHFDMEWECPLDDMQFRIKSGRKEDVWMFFFLVDWPR